MVAAGDTIGGRFRVDHLLGAGGMGIVVAATHLELGHRVAIKLLRDEMAANPTIVERFLREARSVVQLRTDHVCRVFDVGRLETGGLVVPYMVMELLEGSDLGRAVARQPLPLTAAVEYVMQACVALAEAHAAGIVHRDLKPANLFLTRRLDGGPLIKVLDFGIAKAMADTAAHLTHSNMMMGSPGYVSPEQLQSARNTDSRTDIWALGVTLYQLLSARLPFYRPNPTEMAVRILGEPPDPLDVAPALRAAVFRCLEKSPAQRYRDVAALAADLAPFGGPSGRAIVQLVQQMSRKSAGWSAGSSVPAALPAVDAAAATVGAADASLVVDRRSGTQPTPSRAATATAGSAAPRRPWGWIAATLAVVVAIAGGGITWCRGRPLEPATVALGSSGSSAARLGATGSGAAGVPGAARASGAADVPGVPDRRGTPSVPDGRDAPNMPDAPDDAHAAAGSIGALHGAPDDAAVLPLGIGADPAAVLVGDTLHGAGSGSADGAPKSRSNGRHPAGQRAGSGAAAGSGAGSGSGRVHGAQQMTVAEAMAQANRLMETTCRQLVAPAIVDNVPPVTLVTCWCHLKDQAKATAAFARLSAASRDPVRRQCASLGVKLP